MPEKEVHGKKITNLVYTESILSTFFSIAVFILKLFKKILTSHLFPKNILHSSDSWHKLIKINKLEVTNRQEFNNYFYDREVCKNVYKINLSKRLNISNVMSDNLQEGNMSKFHVNNKTYQLLLCSFFSFFKSILKFSFKFQNI